MNHQDWQPAQDLWPLVFRTGRLGGKAAADECDLTPATERMFRQSAWFAAHLSDRIIDQSPLDQSPHEQNG